MRETSRHIAMRAGIITKALVGIGLATLLVLVVAGLMNWNHIRIRYHVMLLQDARQPVAPQNESRVRYSMHWLRWLLEGKPERQKQRDAAWKHEEALIKLGYCERRAYSLTNGTMVDFGKKLVGHKFTDGLIMLETAGGLDRVVVFAPKEDFPFLEEKIKEVAKEKKNKQ